MDLLIVVGKAEPSRRLLARARQVIRAESSACPTDIIAKVRGHRPREIAVTGRHREVSELVSSLQRFGIPVRTCPDELAWRGDISAPQLDGPIQGATSLLDLIGNTPLVHLDRIGRDLDCTLLGKLELLNPGGSIKDRAALAMVEAAERAGVLGPGSTVVEPTSGNTGVGLAIVAARRRYRCIFVMPDKMSREKVALLEAYGATVVVCPTAVPPDHPDSYYSVANRLTQEISGAVQLNQYGNPANPEAHYSTTGPEIWRQTGGQVTHVVAGIGTGGTISGIGRYLKSMAPNVKVIGVDPEGSVYSGGTGRPYLVEGIGEDFWPPNYDPSIVDEVVPVTDADAFLMTRRLVREEGILAGGSSGAAVWGTLQVAQALGPAAVVVTILPDSGRNYLSTVFNDRWMADLGFIRSRGDTAADVLRHNSGARRGLAHVHPDELVRDAITTMQAFGVSHLPVFTAEPPVAVAEVVGSIDERDLLTQAWSDPSARDKRVSEVMAPPLPVIGGGEPVSSAIERLHAREAALVLESGHPLGVMTRSDVLAFLMGGPSEAPTRL